MRDITDMQHNFFSKELTPCGGSSPHSLTKYIYFKNILVHKLHIYVNFLL